MGEESNKNLWRTEESEQYKRRTYKKLQDLFQTPSIVEYVRAQQIRWLGHIYGIEVTVLRKTLRQ